MSDLLGGVRSLVTAPSGAMRADAGAVRWREPSGPDQRLGVSWSPCPLPDTPPASASEAARAHDAFSLVVEGDTARLQAGISGAVPVYVDMNDVDGADGLHFCTRIEPLVRTGAPIAQPDWNAWAHILAAGGPLGGRTTFAGIRRLQPWSRVSVQPGAPPTVTDGQWPWLDITAQPGAGVDAVSAALAAVVTELKSRTDVTTLLSGGWDSRILTVLAARSEPRRSAAGFVIGASPRAAEVPTAWTTSSDTGTVMEELVAAQVAEELGIQHEIVPPVRDQFGADLKQFARSVDHQTSFHIWLVPLARALMGTSRTVLDGLGGGLFVGGAFPDAGDGRPLLDQRFDRLTRYLLGAEEILHPRVVAEIRDRTRAGFEDVAGPLVDHPFGSTFTAYLTRTLPGISLAPYGLMATAAPVATPFLDDDVVRAALAIPAAEHADGRLYPQVLRAFSETLADLPTAFDLTPRRRVHQRRVASPEAAQVFRDLLTRDPVRELLAPELAAAGLATWQAYLDLTRPQHLIRGLATLALWLEQYDDVLGGAGIEPLLGKA
ncbi:asparagine synthase-related protein [Phytoactinopolyspora limicola]|uniref:asparagine synthase-related protein n=1 Tax=Phytoactinopolyspora limicola TaxID=2715536 RepID=UPI00140BEE21|nr:asparagine synthase-related protein [Phytoactinopolyspora limicola]